LDAAKEKVSRERWNSDTQEHRLEGLEDEEESKVAMQDDAVL
jgi:hypothetical protein